MRRLFFIPPALAALCGLMLFATADGRPTEQILTQPFEARGPYWRAAGTDAVSKVVSHGLTAESAHGGQKCEHLRLTVERGSYIHYVYDVPRAPFSEDLNLSLWLKSNRPDVQLYARVVLPREDDPRDAGRKLTLMVRCDTYGSDRWKMISLIQPMKRLQEQQQLKTKQLGRAINVAGAYIDQLVLDVYSGAGTTDVYIDDLTVGPVLDAPAAAGPDNKGVVGGNSPANTPRLPGIPVRPVSREGGAEVKANHLYVGKTRMLMRGIRHTGTPLDALRNAGFNAVWMDESTPDALLKQAGDLGFAVVPTLQPPERGRTVSDMLRTQEFASRVSRFFHHDAVIAWDVGGDLTAERSDDAATLIRAFRELDPARPVVADIRDGLRRYRGDFNRNVMLGTHRWPLMTSLEFTAYREWLNQRRLISMTGYCWTWIQTHLPEWYVRVATDGNDKDGFKDPVGPQPEQIRLLAYTALAAGYRGLAFWSDRHLADSHQGRDRWFALAMLNQELTLLERLLVQASGPPEWLPTSHPEVRCAVFRTAEGILALPIWVGPGSQFVPAQAAAGELTVTVPGCGDTATAWEVTPGRLQSLRMTREAAGSVVKLRNFSLTSAVLFTSGLGKDGIVAYMQDIQRRMGETASRWQSQLADEQLRKAEAVQAKLSAGGYAIPDTKVLLDRAREAIKAAETARADRQWTESYNRSEVALRAIRLLMRAQWEHATNLKDFESPVCSPYAVSYYSLPKHYAFMARIAKSRPGSSVLPHGDFELPLGREMPSWTRQEAKSLDEVIQTVERVAKDAHAGKQCLMLKVTPRDAATAPRALERTALAVSTPVLSLPPGTTVRVSAWLRLPGGVHGSPDGALFFDSAGGEPLAFRRTAAQPKWQKVSLYRTVPASGRIHATVAITGMGTLYVDDMRIEPLEPTDVAARPAGR